MDSGPPIAVEPTDTGDIEPGPPVPITPGVETPPVDFTQIVSQLKSINESLQNLESLQDITNDRLRDVVLAVEDVVLEVASIGW